MIQENDIDDLMFWSYTTQEYHGGMTPHSSLGLLVYDILRLCALAQRGQQAFQPCFQVSTKETRVSHLTGYQRGTKSGVLLCERDVQAQSR